MIKKLVIILFILVAIVTLKFCATYAINENMITKYKGRDYSFINGRPLYFLNISEKYIAYYNNGNLYFQNEDFEKAVEAYREALRLRHPKNGRDCKIRINLVLAMLRTFDLENLDEKKINDILQILSEAKEILIENGCANRYDRKGHSEEAEVIKKEIEDLEKMLNNKLKQMQNKEDENNNPKKEDKPQDQQGQSIENKLREFQEKANEQREYKIDNNYHNFEYYKGQSW